MSNVQRFLNLCAKRGSDVVYHKDDSAAECPCRTEEGFRDPFWHVANPESEVCNESGFLPAAPVHTTVKGFVQPALGMRPTKMTDEQLAMMFGELEVDDHIGIFPVNWQGLRLDFQTFSSNGEDYVEYFGRRFHAVNVNLIPDPADGNPEHHWEIALRLASKP